MSVLDDEQKTVVRLTLEETSLAGPAGAGLAAATAAADHRGPRLRQGARTACMRTLEQELGFKPADEPLVDEAVRVAGGVPGGLPDQDRRAAARPTSARTPPPRPCSARCSR